LVFKGYTYYATKIAPFIKPFAVIAGLVSERSRTMTRIFSGDPASSAG